MVTDRLTIFVVMLASAGLVTSCSTPAGHSGVVGGIPIILNGDEPAYLTIEEHDFSAPLDLNAVAAAADVDRVLWACRQGYDVDVRDNNGDTPLHNVAINSVKVRELFTSYGLQWDQERPARVVNILIDYGADLHLENHFGMTPLHVAALANNSIVANALIARGAEIDIKSMTGDTPLYVAVLNGNLEVLRQLLDAGSSNDLRYGESKATALHMAVAKGNVDVVRLLVDYGASVNAKTAYGETPIDTAKRLGRSGVLNVLAGN